MSTLYCSPAFSLSRHRDFYSEAGCLTGVFGEAGGGGREGPAP
jgi:hypothetical protein